MRLNGFMANCMRPTVLAGTGFLAIGAGIAVNALLLQPARHPAPIFSVSEPDVSAEEASPDPLIEAVQTALRDSGDYRGPVDGVAGPQTAAAIIAFEQRLGRDPSGQASDELLAAILAAETSAAPAAVGSIETAADAPPASDEIAAVQKALARAAYGPLQTDGVFGPQTRDAIRRFQADHGLPVTGEIRDALIIELRAAGALDGG